MRETKACVKMTPEEVQRAFDEYQQWADRCAQFLLRMRESQQFNNDTNAFLSDLLESQPCLRNYH